MREIWKDIKGYEGYYQASDMGRIRSLDRPVLAPSGARMIRKGHPLKQRVSRYNQVTLCKHGKTKTYLVHRLVANTFICNRYKKPEVNHINGNKIDNRRVNLEWVTRRENIDHAMKYLKVNQRENNGRAILTESQVKNIKHLLSLQLGTRKIAKMYNMSDSAIQDIKHKRNWV